MQAVKRRGKRKATDEEEEEAARAANDRLLQHGAPELATWQAAAAAGAVVTASRALQDCAVGLHENDGRLTRHNISATQRRVLSMVGAARGRGALQVRREVAGHVTCAFDCPEG